MREDVKEYVRTCVRCQLTKNDLQKPKGLLIPIPSPAPWHTITLDFVGKFTPSCSSGKTHCLVIVDKFSKYVILEPVYESVTAKDTADILIRRVISEHGVPARVISDRGPQFTSEVWRKVLEGFGTNIALAATHHPQSDGQTERTIRTLIQLLRAFTNQQQDTWEEVLPLLQFALNHAHCEATSSTPFRILLRRDPRSPLDFTTPSGTNTPNEAGYEPDARLKQKLDEVNRFIQERQDEVMARMKSQADRHRRNYTFEPGDQVLLSTKSHPALVGNRKQQDLRVGPFVVRQRINDNAYELEGLPPAVPSTQNITFLSPFYPNVVRFSTRPQEDVALPEVLEDSIEWEVERVTDFRQARDGSRRYRVKWIGAQREQWLPESEMGHCTQSIRDYFITRDLPIPTAVNRFCTTAKAAATTNEINSDDDNDPPTFLWDSTSEEED